MVLEPPTRPFPVKCITADQTGLLEDSEYFRIDGMGLHPLSKVPDSEWTFFKIPMNGIKNCSDLLTFRILRHHFKNTLRGVWAPQPEQGVPAKV